MLFRFYTNKFLLLLIVAGTFFSGITVYAGIVPGTLVKETKCCLYYDGEPLDTCNLYKFVNGNAIELDDIAKDSKFQCQLFEDEVGKYLLTSNSGNRYDVSNDPNDIYFLIRSNLVGSPGQGAIEGDMSACAEVPGYVSQQSTNADAACPVGLALTETNSTFKKKLQDTLLSNFKTGLESTRTNLCCIPVKKLGGSCGSPLWNELGTQAYVTGEYDELAKYYYTTMEWNAMTLSEPVVADVFTCEPNNPNWTDEWDMYAAPCDDVIGSVLPPGKTQSAWDEYKIDHPDASLGVKFTVSSWCSVYDAGWVKHCACSADKSECSPTAYEEKSDCETSLVGKFSGKGQCLQFGPAVKEMGVKSCSDFIKKKTKKDEPAPASALDSKKLLKKLDPIDTTLQEFFGRLIQIGLGVLGTVALLMFVWGGIMWMTAMGNSDRSQKAFSTLLWATLGIIVILASYAVVDFVFNSFK